jgi:hypothetical protein
MQEDCFGNLSGGSGNFDARQEFRCGALCSDTRCEYEAIARTIQ